LASWLVVTATAVYTGRAVRTYSPKAAEIRRDWHEVDASGAVLGRLASEVARVLRGKHKATFAPHLDTGDYVIVVNAAKVVLSAGKGDRKFHYRYSGYPGGITSRSYAEMLAKRPEEVVRLSVKGMLPKGPLGRRMLRKLKVYAGPEHPHAAQGPKPLSLDHSVHRVA
jgi:large subunit ribosomal protein L13